MLFGNMIFIKKTGGDGSKYPVTQKSVKIGKSEECLIRIYNPQVAPEHCQIIIDDNGQAKLRNMSNCTILNGKPLNKEDVTLCHGDTFKIGERLARWEYLPSSKYYKQPFSPSGRLIAVVMPQQRSLNGTPGTSASQGSVSKSTPLGSKRRFSEKVTSGNGSVKKVARISSTSKSVKNRSNFLTGRHSLTGPKVLLQTPKIKHRKSISGVVSAKSLKVQPVEKTRKSTLPSWKVNIVTPLSVEKSTERRSSSGRIATPIATEKLTKSVRRSAVKTSLKTIMESSPKEAKELPTPIKSISKSPSQGNNSASPPKKTILSTPKQKSSPKTTKLIHSEKKRKSATSPPHVNGMKRMSLILNRVKTPVTNEIRKGFNSEPRKKVKTLKSDLEVSGFSAQVSPEVGSIDEKEKKTPGKSVSSAKTTPSKRTSRKSLKTPKKISPSPSKGVKSSSEQEKITSPRKRLPDSESPVKSVEKSRGRAQSLKRVSSPKKSGSPSKRKSEASPRGVRRKLSPSISSAERAAKKLKTSSPRKPDKNKKAALLVLGKANRKQLQAQNVKVLLKQKIVKKAIKQSIMPPIRKDESKKSIPVKKVTRGPSKVSAKRKKKSNKTEGITERKSSKLEVSRTPSKSPTKSSNEGTPGYKKEEVVLVTSKLSPQGSPHSTAVVPVEKSPKSPSRQSKKSISTTSSSSKSTPPEKSPSGILRSESYLFSANRRSSKRLSSKNDTSRPDFMELSPTALGLIPKNVEFFKTPKEKKRRSSSLTTPKSVRTGGIIKSASTSKIGHRKSVRFSSKDVSISSLPPVERSDLDFESFQTPNVTLDLFVSPLLDGSKGNANDSTVQERSRGKVVPSSRTPRSSLSAKKCVRKLLESPQSQKESPTSSPKALKAESPQVPMVERQAKVAKMQSPKRESLNDKAVQKSTKTQKSPKNSLTDLTGVRRLLRTPRDVKSPKNDLTDVKGVKKLLQTPKVQKSPKNDLTDVRGVKKLLQTPKVQKSPRNDLSDIRGVKKLLRTPKVQKSPKNDLTDVRGVKKLLKTPKEQKSPKNDLTDVRGVKKLLQTPKVQKSPKNDLSDVRGVKKLLQSPKNEKSPKNDLRDVSGVLELFKSPVVQRSPKNDLSDVVGVRRLLRTPKHVNSPKNDLSDVRGVKQLLQSPKNQKSPKNDLMDVSGVGQLFESPKEQKSPRKSSGSLERQSPRSPKNLAVVAGVKQLLVAKTPESGLKSKKSTPRKSHVNDFRAIRGRRTIYTTPKGPKNDLSDVTGVRELFARHKPTSDFDISLTGVAELFDLPPSQAVVQKQATRGKKTVVEEEKTVKEATIVATRSTRRRKEPETEVSKKQPVKRKAAETTEISEPTASRTRGRPAKKARDVKSVKDLKETKPSKRKASEVVPEPSPPKLRRKLASSKTVTFEATSKSSKESAPKESAPTETVPVKKEERVSRSTSKATKSQSKVQTRTTRTGTKASAKTKDSKTRQTTKVQTKTSKTTIKAGSKPTSKVQNEGSQTRRTKKVTESLSEDNVSPIKTRNVKVTAVTKGAKAPTKTVGTRGKAKVTPVTKRSTRRK